jgi:ubiquinone/menaquinone biosynthesis C-methylase UbiE
MIITTENLVFLKTDYYTYLADLKKGLHFTSKLNRMINFTEAKFRAVYWFVNKLDKQKKLHFMNFGYSDPDKIPKLDSSDESNRYCIQLYQHLTDQIELNNKDIVEIGSGRGGGLAHLARNSTANSLKGIDLSRAAVDFSNNKHRISNLSFECGDAQELHLPNDSSDVVLNVESSHRYPEMEKFLSEVIRILKKGGHFLFTDFRYEYEWKSLNEMFSSSGLKILFEEDITSKVIHALEMDDQRRRDLVRELAPRYMQNAMLNFSGAIGSETYNYFVSRKYVYKSYTFQKE